MSECEVRLKCDPLSSLEDSINKELDFKWKVPQHLQKQPQVTFIQTKDLLKIPVAKVGYSGIYQCEVYVNGLPQSSIEQELIVVNQLPPNIYKEFEMKFPDRQCRYNDKYTYQRIRRDVKHLFGNTDSMNIYFYTSHWHCDTNKKKVQFRFYPKLPLTTVIEGKSTPTAVIQVSSAPHFVLGKSGFSKKKFFFSIKYIEKTYKFYKYFTKLISCEKKNTL